MSDFINWFRSRNLIILDGAMGTQLQARGVQTELPLWSTHALMSAPDIVKQIHVDFVNAGAQIIRTNTFRTNARTLKKAKGNLSDSKLTSLAARLAKEAIKECAAGGKVFIGGSQAPLEDCYRPDLVPDEKTCLMEHKRWSQILADGGVDFIFLETFNSTKEAICAVRAAKETALPVCISFVCDDKARLLSGEKLEDAAGKIEKLEPFAVMINCMQPQHIDRAIKILSDATILPIGAYGQGPGRPSNNKGWEFENTPEAIKKYSQHVNKWINAGAKIIGGCCGTSPEYIREISRQQSLDNRY